MPTYKKAGNDVKEMAQAILEEYESHEPLLSAGVRIDFMMAYPDYDEASGEPINDAIKQNGVKALALCRKIGLKDRTKGQGDAEILLDGDWWDDADEADKKALLDHELHHLVPTKKLDDLGRPLLKLRRHDYQFGWFSIIAQRHGIHSQERKQAASMMEIAGQYFWPEIAAVRGNDARMHHIEVEARR